MHTYTAPIYMYGHRPCDNDNLWYSFYLADKDLAQKTLLRSTENPMTGWGVALSSLIDFLVCLSGLNEFICMRARWLERRTYIHGFKMAQRKCSNVTDDCFFPSLSANWLFSIGRIVLIKAVKMYSVWFVVLYRQITMGHFVITFK